MGRSPPASGPASKAGPGYRFIFYFETREKASVFVFLPPLDSTTATATLPAATLDHRRDAVDRQLFDHIPPRLLAGDAR
jgi:hypothetical protein